MEGYFTWCRQYASVNQVLDGGGEVLLGGGFGKDGGNSALLRVPRVHESADSGEDDDREAGAPFVDLVDELPARAAREPEVRDDDLDRGPARELVEGLLHV